MIEVRNIYKTFEDQEVLHDISVGFEQGKINLIIGQSGSGKTVLMKAIVGLINADGGEVMFDDRSFTKMNFSEKKEIRKEIGMLFQGAALFDSLTVEDNVNFPLMMFTDMSNDEKSERVNFCLQRVNLAGTNALFPSELSGGMKKRVAIARAISLNPRYLFCDEPNSGLDPITATVIDELIKEITYEYNITTVVNTHDLSSVMEIGDKVIFIYKGRKWWEGSKDDILNSDNKELNEFVYSNRFLKNHDHSGGH